jgi:predicted RNA-binding Zn-ribbon protein involved in translation (DUF1610 family)
MTLDKASCPHCGARVGGDDLLELNVSSGGIAPMGAGKDSDTLYVCPECEAILG